MDIHHSTTYTCGEHALYNRLMLHDWPVVCRIKWSICWLVKKDDIQDCYWKRRQIFSFAVIYIWWHASCTPFSVHTWKAGGCKKTEKSGHRWTLITPDAGGNEELGLQRGLQACSNCVPSLSYPVGCVEGFPLSHQLIWAATEIIWFAGTAGELDFMGCSN